MYKKRLLPLYLLRQKSIIFTAFVYLRFTPVPSQTTAVPKLYTWLSYTYSWRNTYRYKDIHWVSCIYINIYNLLIWIYAVYISIYSVKCIIRQSLSPCFFICQSRETSWFIIKLSQILTFKIRIDYCVYV